jgi:hypothetical protein
MKKQATKRKATKTTKDLSLKDASAVKGGSISLPYTKIAYEY